MTKKVVNFNDFNREIEKSDLKDTSRGFSKNTNDGQQVVGNQKMVYNKVTRKWDNVTKDMIDDKIDAIDKVEESIINESKGSDFLEWLKELKEEIKGESAGSGSAWNHGRDELISQIYKKAKKMLG